MAFADHTAARVAGWFSRKHQSAEAHLAVKEANAQRSEQKFASAWARQAASNKLTDAQKLAKLPATGANRERARLTARIAAAKLSKEQRAQKQADEAAKRQARKADDKAKAASDSRRQK